jgi:hypothetical protein
MNFRCKSTLALVAVLMLPLLFGCGSSDDSKKDKDHDESGHHAEKGPHGGHLIELGRDHKFHAELVEDHKSGTISIYILDGEMKEYPIAEPSVTLTIIVEGASVGHELTAAQPTDGKTSRFDSADETLHEKFEEHEEAEVKLRVTIDGTPYTGTLKHDHDEDDDHAGHND